MDLNEKIIEYVRPYKCLYDSSQKDYKNYEMKAKIWTSIAAQLNESCDTVRKKWRTMRDGYIKYKKQLKSTEWSDKKFTNYIWASQLSFLDEVPNSSDSNIKICEINQIKSGDNIVFINNCTSPSTLAKSVIIPDVTLPHSMQEIPSSSYQTYPQSSELLTGLTSKPEKHIQEQDVDSMIVNFLQSRSRKRSHDSVDYLFLSYAQTFKRLTTRRQAALKVELARIFAQAELSDLDTNEDVQKWSHGDLGLEISPENSRSSVSGTSSSTAISDCVIVKEEQITGDITVITS